MSSPRFWLFSGIWSLRRWRTYWRSLSTSLCSLWTIIANHLCITSMTSSWTSWWSRTAHSSRSVKLRYNNLSALFVGKIMILLLTITWIHDSYLISDSGSNFRACTRRWCISISSTTEKDLPPQEMRSACIGSDSWPITWRKPTFLRWHTTGFREPRLKCTHF